MPDIEALYILPYRYSGPLKGDRVQLGVAILIGDEEGCIQGLRSSSGSLCGRAPMAEMLEAWTNRV